MATATAQRPLLRMTGDRVLGGVCAAIARRFGIDALLVRIAFIVATAAGGFGLPVYLLGWLFIPREDGTTRRFGIPGGRATAEVGIGAAFLVLAVMLAVRASGLVWFSDAITWPALLVVTGGVLIWRSSQSSPAVAEPPAATAATATTAPPPNRCAPSRAPRGWPAPCRAPASASCSCSRRPSCSCRRPARWGPRATWRSRRPSSPSRSA
jgi:phage shock protein PspC (stress-responsive transcriptional regulator)